jgi:hypothetical protein
MRRAWHIGLASFVALAVTSCGGTSRVTPPEVTGATSADPAIPKLPPARPARMTGTPAGALASCSRMRLMRPVCPGSVPVGRLAQATLTNVCADQRGRGVPITSGACIYETWMLEAGAPAGLPPDAPPGLPGNRTLGPSRTRPPGYVHIVIYASQQPLANMVPWPWPNGPAQPVTNALLNPKRTRPISLGWFQWGSDYGQLVLAPPYLYGGVVGDHLIFRFTAGRVNYAVTLHSWAPLSEAAATLRVVVKSGPLARGVQ